MDTTPPASPRAARFAAPFAAALVLIAALAVPATSFAQATRTWVSGVGDDANPCSRTAPCKTFAGAISKTAAGGEIDALDPGGFGTVTITKSITISGVGTNASILASGVTGIQINAGATDRVTLTNLSINGAGTTLGVNGVKVFSAGTVRLENDNIFNFSNNGVDFEPNVATPNPQPRLVVENTTIDDVGGAGVLALPLATLGQRISVINSHLDEDGCGVSAGGPCTATTGSGFPVIATTIGSSILDSGTGGGTGASGNGAAIQSVGSTAASIVGADQIIGNTIALSKVASGGIFSFGDNDVFGNASNGAAPTGVTKLSKIWNTIHKRAQAIARSRKHRAKKK